MSYLQVIALLTFCVSLSTSSDTLCQTACHCENNDEQKYMKMDCSRVWFSIVPPVTDWPANITHMDLSSNNISALDTELSHASVLVLDLSHNRIHSVTQSAFGGLINLQYLNLANNVIRHFEDNGFYGLDHLKSLNLSSNGLETLPDNIFYNFIGLQELSLSDNPLVHLDPNHFNRMINLRWLDLSNIKAYVFQPNIFHNTGQLEFLDLSYNDFHNVPINALRSAKNLKHLRLNGNPLETIDKKSFIKMSSLEILELSHIDKLQHVEEMSFSDLTNLRSLQMRYNRHLSYIHPQAFDGLFNSSRPVLQELDLEGNQLRYLYSGMTACAKMRKFNLQKNPWTCDCTLKWIKECHIQLIYSADLKCSKPETLTNVLISTLSEDDFKCEHAQSDIAFRIVHHEHVVRSVSIGLGVTLLVVLAFGLALLFKWRDIKEWYRFNRKGPGAVYYVRARANPGHI